MTKIKERFWIWGHEAGSHDNRWGLGGPSKITPAEGAAYLDMSNIIMVRSKGKPAPPFEQYPSVLGSLKQVVWSIVSPGGKIESGELDAVLDLARRAPNMCGVIMDDFFKAKPDEKGNIAAYTLEELKAIKKRLVLDGRKLELWVTFYTANLDLPDVGKHLKPCDVMTYWTWYSKDLNDLEQNFERLEKLVPSKRKLLGCYMWDYGDKKPLSIPLMEHQCNLGLKWLREGRIEGMIFLASCICDMGLEAVEFTRKWIQEVDEKSLCKHH